MLPDAFTRWLQKNQPSVHPVLYQPGAFLGAPPTGWAIELGRSRLVYRIPDTRPDLLYLVLIERAAPRAALHSPLADFVRFLQLLQRSDCGVRTVRGHVEPSRGRPSDALSRERLLAFYRRYLTAVDVGHENGVEWFGGDLANFSWAREKRKVRDFAVAVT